jgi:hypothetical protein
VCIAALAWRHVGLARGATVMLVVAVVMAIWDIRASEATYGSTNRMAVMLFVVVPTAVLVGVSRLRWLSRHAWLLLIAGPLVFAGCYVGICEFCVKTGLI